MRGRALRAVWVWGSYGLRLEISGFMDMGGVLFPSFGSRFPCNVGCAYYNEVMGYQEGFDVVSFGLLEYAMAT